MAVPTEIPEPLMQCLLCPTCRAVVGRTDSGYVCAEGHHLDLSRGYLDARPAQLSDVEASTVASFGYEWTHFDQIQEESQGYWQRYFADVDLADLAERVGLDAGCGSGRYTYFTAAHLRALAALDSSDAVVSAWRNLQNRPNTLVVRADLRQAPFAPGSFGFICSLGVLHHLEDPRSGFDSLVELLAPGGLLLVYLYSRPLNRGFRAHALRAASLLRTLTVRLPHRLLRLLSLPIACLLYLAVVLPGHAWARIAGSVKPEWPLSAYHGQPVRSLWLDTFDRLSAPVEHRFVWDDLAPWYAHHRLEVLACRERNGLHILARRPHGA